MDKRQMLPAVELFRAISGAIRTRLFQAVQQGCTSAYPWKNNKKKQSSFIDNVTELV